MMPLLSSLFRTVFALGLTSIAFPSTTFASLAENQTSSIPGAGGAILPIIANTALIVAVVLGLGWVVKRAGLTSGARSGGIEILASQSVGAKEKILVVQVGNTQLVVGSTPGNIRTLYSTDEALLPAAQSPETTAFSSRLSAILQGKAS